jgi:hypothetical protein
MNTLRKSLLAVAAVFSLTPTVVFAYPPQCDEIWVCDRTPDDCDTICYIGLVRTNCGAAGYCGQGISTQAEPTASVMEGASRQAENSAPVCLGADAASTRTASISNLSSR